VITIDAIAVFVASGKSVEVSDDLCLVSFYDRGAFYCWIDPVLVYHEGSGDLHFSMVPAPPGLVVAIAGIGKYSIAKSF